jgi:acyl-CoA thioesterase-2
MLRVETSDDTSGIQSLIDLERRGPTQFRSRVNEMNFSGGLYGGQMLSQGMEAALATVEGKAPHSLHGYFLNPGDIHEPLDYDVELTRDGGSFANRRVQVTQGARALMDMRVSFHVGEQAIVHQIDPRPAPDPETLAGRDELMARWKDRMTPMVLARLKGGHCIDARAVDPEQVFWGANPSPRSAYWARMPSAADLTEAQQPAALAYMTDYVMTVPILLPCGDARIYRDMRLTSLDHAIWFHRPWPAHEWLLFETESPVAANGRGLLRACVYARSGELVMSMAQEMVLRPRNGLPPLMAGDPGA